MLKHDVTLSISETRTIALECIRLTQSRMRSLSAGSQSWRNQPIIMRQDDMSDSSFIEGASTNRPRVQSASSSIASISSTLIEGDDDDTRVFRRLISNKVEVWLDDSEEEVDKAIAWLRIVKDALQRTRTSVLRP